ncbi:MAG: hypothetical protein IT371_22695 [Deltaproteobacteria bacterium]|nr:hypothetical protein [Deltaproteobacteria bacterium]
MQAGCFPPETAQGRFPSPRLRALTFGALLLAGCPGGRAPGANPTTCPKIPTCNSACCDAQRYCMAQSCENVVWYCTRNTSGQYSWQLPKPTCLAGPRDGGSLFPDGPLAGDGAGPGAEAGPPCSGTSCGAHASCAATGCVCEAGFKNADGSWDNGCEAAQAPCDPMSCGGCPAGYCGANAVCRDNQKCRCVGQWLNSDGDWGNGCEENSPACSPTNCNACSTGYCGAHANCNQNRCVCTTPGQANCDGDWNGTGCECKR